MRPAEAGEGEVLRLLGGLVAPRPLVLLSTLDHAGRLNLAPFSMVTPLAVRPALVGLSIHPRRDGARKATLVNVLRSGEMVLNAVTPDLLPLVLECGGSGRRDGGGAALVPSLSVGPPRLQVSPVQLECRLSEVLRPAGTSASFVVARVERLHFDQALLEPDADPRSRPVGHLGMVEDGQHIFWAGTGLFRGRVANGGPARLDPIAGPNG